MIFDLLKTPWIKVSIRYGAIAGLLCMGFVISFYYMGKHPFLISPFFDFRIPIFVLLIFFSLKEIRDYYQDGLLNFLQALGGTFVFTLVFAIITSALIWLFCTMVPEFVTDYIRLTYEQVGALPADVVARIGKDQLDSNLKVLSNTQGLDLAMDYFGKSFLISFFISVIISLILRRQPKTN